MRKVVQRQFFRNGIMKQIYIVECLSGPLPFTTSTLRMGVKLYTLGSMLLNFFGRNLCLTSPQYATLFVPVTHFHPSLIFTGKARSLPLDRNTK